MSATMTRSMNAIKSTLKGTMDNVIDAGDVFRKRVSGPGSFTQNLSKREMLEASSRTRAMMAKSMSEGGVAEGASYLRRAQADSLAAKAMPS